MQLAVSPIRCKRCDYQLASFEPGCIYMSPDWQLTGAGHFELPTQVASRIRDAVRRLRRGELVEPARTLPRPFDHRATTRKRFPQSPAELAWMSPPGLSDKLPFGFQCPCCGTVTVAGATPLELS